MVIPYNQGSSPLLLHGSCVNLSHTQKTSTMAVSEVIPNFFFHRDSGLFCRGGGEMYPHSSHVHFFCSRKKSQYANSNCDNGCGAPAQSLSLRTHWKSRAVGNKLFLEEALEEPSHVAREFSTNLCCLLGSLGSRAQGLHGVALQQGVLGAAARKKQTTERKTVEEERGRKRGGTLIDVHLNVHQH